MYMFLIFTLVFVITGACLFNFLYLAIQDGQILGKWQNVLSRIYHLTLLHKLLGGCKVCFAHLISILTFVLYVVFVNTLGMWALSGFINIIWYIVFVTTTWMLSVKTSDNEL